MEILRLLPKNLLSRVVGWIVSLERPRVFALAVRDWFAKKYRLNLDEAEHPIDHYPSMAKLFIRRLKPGARPIADGIIHPCDSVLTQVEHIESGMLVQAKGRLYSIDALLGEAQSPKLKDGIIEKPALRSAASFQGGVALTYYLCPTDYHRVHAPADLQLEEVVYVPGQLWPVNMWSVENIHELFTVNERAVLKFRGPQGPVALVMVGATNVGKITLSHVPGFITNAGKKQVERIRFDQPISVKKGEEIGVFNLGSTVVLLYGPGYLPSLPASGPVQLGQACR